MRLGRSICVLVGAVSACREPTGTVPPSFSRPSAATWVTPQVRLSLDAAGHFVLPSHVLPGNRPTISPGRAVELAEAFMRSFVIGASTPLAAPSGFSVVPLRDAIEQIHGRRVDWTTVVTAPWPPYYMESPVQPISGSIPDALRQYLGPRYHVLFLASDAVVADVMVSVYATQVVTSADGHLIVALSGGEEFRVEGVAAGLTNAVPLIPEAAVRHVGEKTGAQVAAVPELVGPWQHFSPIFARWRLELDRPVSVRRADTGESLSTSTIFIGLGQRDAAGSTVRWYVGAPLQPDGEPWPYRWPASGASGAADSVRLRFAPGAATDLVLVVPP